MAMLVFNGGPFFIPICQTIQKDLAATPHSSFCPTVSLWLKSVLLLAFRLISLEYFGDNPLRFNHSSMFRAMSLVHASGAGSAGVRNSLLPILSSTVGQARTFANGASDPIASARAADAALADNGGSTNRPFVSATWLEKNLDKAVVIDSSWRLSNPDPKVTPYEYVSSYSVSVMWHLLS